VAHHFVGLLDHRFLVFADGDYVGFKGGDVGRLRNGVDHEAGGDRFAKVFLLDLLFDGGVVLEAVPGDEVEVVHGEFREGRDHRLDEDGRFGGVDTDGEVVKGDVEDVLAHFFGAFGVISEGLGIGDHDELGRFFLPFEARFE